jgi:tRNA threonylcarbamoyladenosine biosynthesis protein TsaB
MDEIEGLTDSKQDAGEPVWLLLDAALPSVYAGVLCRGAWLALERRDAPAAETLFPAVETALRRSGVRLEGLSGFFYCEGPGSILGSRIAAMALLTWRRRPGGEDLPCRVYRNLDLLAHRLLAGGATPPFALCSDARRGHWNFVEVASGGEIHAPRRLSDEELATRELPMWRPEETGPSRPAPVETRPLDYDLSDAAPWLYRGSLARPAANPEPWVIKPPEYQKVKR